jgi:hypothetical protein
MATNPYVPYRVDTSLLAPNHLRACIEWVSALGLVPADIGAKFAIVRGRGGWELHVTEHLRNSDGHKYIDQASQQIASRPVVVDLGAEPSWPEFTEGLIA